MKNYFKKLDVGVVYNADSGGTYNILRLYLQKNTPINMVCSILKTPSKISICVNNK